uniref:Uncharacterized protein n=1 Tax=Opuntia streptacantha TaxID=393608 RepID=A0A7C9E389_OPUST
MLMIKWHLGGTMDTRQQPWLTVLSLLTIIHGITLTLLLLEQPCLPLRRQHGKSLTLLMLNMSWLYLEVLWVTPVMTSISSCGWFVSEVVSSLTSRNLII